MAIKTYEIHKLQVLETFEMGPMVFDQKSRSEFYIDYFPEEGDRKRIAFLTKDDVALITRVLESLGFKEAEKANVQKEQKES